MEVPDKLDSILGTITDGIVVVDAHGVVLYANQAAENLFERGPLPGKSLGIPTQSSAIHRDINLIRPSGVLWAEMRSAPIEWDGRQAYVIGMHDISARKQAEIELRASQTHFQTLAKMAPVGIYRTDHEGRCIYVNERWLEIAGVTAEQAKGDGWSAVLFPDDRPVVMAAWMQAILSGQDFNLQYRFQRPDGEIVWVLGLAEAERDVTGRLLGFVGTITDISHYKISEDQLRLAALVYQNSSEAMMVVDDKNRILAVNPAFSSLTGYAPVDVIGETPNILNSGKHGAEFYERMWEQLNTTGSWQGEIWNRRKNGEIYPEWLAINTIFDDAGAVERRVALFTDISEKKRTEESIWRQANYDTLTGLPNRQLFHNLLERDIKRATREQKSLALFFLDLDHFKEINDTLGHQQGDELLRMAARRLEYCVRETDTVARLGGDEFTVILPNLSDLTDIDRVARCMIDCLAEPFPLGEAQAYVSVSIGITICPGDADNVDTLIKQADQAMYAAKAQGRNRFSFFTAALQRTATYRMKLSHDLRAALALRQFEVYYQPIVDLATGRVQKAEALIRWLHPELGFVSPMEFIPIAEDCGLIDEIGDWVFENAVHRIRAWRSLIGADFQISINKSPAQFRDKSGDHRSWLRNLQRWGLEGRHLVVEITEGLLLDAKPDILEKLLQLRDFGIQVAIDDFGTGYSALSYLKKFDIDYLKIDRVFTSNLARGSSDFILSEAIVLMAHKLGLKVIAEGVETEEQRELLTAIGCDYGQGYLFAKPMPCGDFETYLRRC